MLFSFLQEQGFCADRDALEAILRRCDHEGDQDICFEDFCELVSARPFNQTLDEKEQEDFQQSKDQKSLNQVVLDQHVSPRPESKREFIDESLATTFRKL